jgi:hypothetical protein
MAALLVCPMISAAPPTAKAPFYLLRKGGREFAATQEKEISKKL